jgi:hypothetical protein
MLGLCSWFYGCPIGIVCESKKQRCVTNSTSEAELIAASLGPSITRRCKYLRVDTTLTFVYN